MSAGRYEVRITPAAQKELDQIPQPQRSRVEQAIAALADDPRPVGTRKMKGIQDTYRLRVGNYRVLYQIRDQELVVLVVSVGDRKDVYRRK